MRFGALVAVAVLAAAPAEAARPTRRPPVGPPAGPPPLAEPALPPDVGPLDATLAWPPLHGPDQGLDIGKMLRSKVSFDLSYDRAWLTGVDEAERELLLTYLEASPLWRVGDVEGVPGAVRREPDDRGWASPATGYHLDATARWRVTLRFAPWPEGSPWAAAPGVVRVHGDRGAFALPAFVDHQGGTYGLRTTALSLGGPQVWLDVYEQGHPDHRDLTIDALVGTQHELLAVLARARRIRDEGVTAMPLPPGEPGCAAEITLAAAGPGRLDVRGRVNPGTRGWTWVRLVRDGLAWEEAAVGAGTKERVGASPDPTHAFWFQSQFPVPSGEGFAATAELWHQPDGGAPRRLATFPVTVPAR